MSASRTMRSASRPQGKAQIAPSTLFISWVRFHRRSQGIADALGIHSHYVHAADGGPLRRYAAQTVETARILRAARPSTVILMQPPVVALLVVRALTLFRSVRIIGDLHSGVFLDPKWKWAKGLTLWLLRGRHGAIVTNEPLARIARQRSVRTLVLHDLVNPIPVDSASAPPPVSGIADGRPLILVPLAYANDEPVDEILTAAGRVENAMWILTGKAPESIREEAPANVRFSGYVTNQEYDWLLQNASVAVALTTREYTMQCVGYEAMSAAKPLVTSSTESLREFFGRSAVYADPTADAIAMAVKEALERSAELTNSMSESRNRQIAEQTKALEELVAWAHST